MSNDEGEGRAQASRASFPVSVLLYIEDQGLRDRVRREAPHYNRGAAVEGHNESFSLSTHVFDTEEGLRNELKLRLVGNRAGTVVLVSDRLLARDAAGRVVLDPRGKAAPGPVVHEVRRQFLFGPTLLGMVGLNGGPARRVRDIDLSVSVDDLKPETIREAILDVALALRMKSPPPRREVDTLRAGKTIRVEVVQSKTHLRQCFAIRHAVYGKILHYLPDEIVRHRAGVEIDYFDTCSVHFAAVREATNEVIATMRLVLNYPSHKSLKLAGSALRPPFALTMHGDWCHAVAKKIGEPFSRKVRAVPHEFGSFPILLSTEFRKNQKQVIDESLHGSEMSRLVVVPAFRGYGISKMLVKAAICKAVQLNRASVLLECIPKHVAMYGKYGFQRLDGAPHSRPCDLDQYAIGMRLGLTQTDVADRARLFLKKILDDPNQPPDNTRYIRFGPFDVCGDCGPVASGLSEADGSEDSGF